MSLGNLYRPENIYRARYVHVAVAVGAVVACGSVLLGAANAYWAMWNAEAALRGSRLESRGLERRSASLRQSVGGLPGLHDGGVEALAVELTNWADARNVRLESVVPDGSPSRIDVEVGGTSLGKWSAGKVRVMGSGPFEQVMSLFSQLSSSAMPFRLEGFSLTAGNGSTSGYVDFQIVLTVYERASKAAK